MCARYALGGLIVSPSAAIAAEPATDDGALIRSLIDGERPIPKRAAPYRIAQSFHLASGTRVSIEDGVSFQYIGADTGSRWGGIRGIFVVEGDHVSIRARGEAFVRSHSHSPFLFAVLNEGHSDLEVAGIVAIDCNQLYSCPRKDATSYERVRTTGSDANVPRRIAVRGGGARFSRLASEAQSGGCTFVYTTDFQVSDARYVNAVHGVQWWGGDSNTAVDGALSNERKCRNGVIRNVVVEGAGGGSVWGSMGEDILVENCRGANSGDVGFDAEGCNRVTFRNCSHGNALNGCFAAFYLNRDIRFENCRGVQDAAVNPLFRLYNVTQRPDNRDIVIEGGRFECRDGIGVFDSASGPALHMAVRNATFVNVRIEMIANNHHFVEITGNRLSFSNRATKRFDAISAGGTNNWNSTSGRVLIERNRILCKTPPPPGSAGIFVTQADYNGSPDSLVRGNDMAGFPVDVRCEWEGANAGVRAIFRVKGNRGSSGVISITDEGAASKAERHVTNNLKRW